MNDPSSKLLTINCLVSFLFPDKSINFILLACSTLFGIVLITSIGRCKAFLVPVSSNKRTSSPLIFNVT